MSHPIIWRQFAPKLFCIALTATLSASASASASGAKNMDSAQNRINYKLSGDLVSNGRISSDRMEGGLFRRDVIKDKLEIQKKISLEGEAIRDVEEMKKALDAVNQMLLEQEKKKNELSIISR